MLAAFWTAIWEFIIGLFKPRKERIEPVIEGYDGLVEAQQSVIDKLNERIDGLENELAKHIRIRKRQAKKLGEAVSEIAQLTKDVKECNDHRQELEQRVKTLETKVPEVPQL